MDDLRDRILTAIREADSHSCMYGEGTDAGGLADANHRHDCTEEPTP